MKKLIFTTLSLMLLFACSQDNTVDTSEVVNNSQACIENLQADTYIQACNDLKTASKDYLLEVDIQESEVDIDLFQNIIDKMTVVTDVSENQGIIDATNDLIINIKEIVNPALKDLELTSYKDLENQESFKLLADDYQSQTSLKYQNTSIIRLDYNNEDFLYKTTFIDDNSIIITYYTNPNKDIVEITIDNINIDRNIYYNYAKVYTNYILINQLKTNRYDADYDSIQVENQLQFHTGEAYRSTNVDINIKDQTVHIIPLSE